MTAGRVQIYDTTLRDGAQRAGISYSAADKLRIAHALDDLGVDFIEAGWPGSNPKDAVFFARARAERWRHATLCAFGATRRAVIVWPVAFVPQRCAAHSVPGEREGFAHPCPFPRREGAGVGRPTSATPRHVAPILPNAARMIGAFTLLTRSH